MINLEALLNVNCKVGKYVVSLKITLIEFDCKFNQSTDYFKKKPRSWLRTRVSTFRNLSTHPLLDISLLRIQPLPATFYRSSVQQQGVLHYGCLEVVATSK